MYSDHKISEQEHLSWLVRTKNDNSQIIFSALNEERMPIGVVNAINNIH